MEKLLLYDLDDIIDSCVKVGYPNPASYNEIKVALNNQKEVTQDGANQKGNKCRH